MRLASTLETALWVAGHGRSGDVISVSAVDTFQETRVYFGVEGQRQWNDLAIARATPLRLALFSLVTLLVHQQPDWQASVRQAAWCQKTLPTFSDALAQVRRCLWRQMSLMLSQEHTERQKIPATLFAHLGELLAHAA